MSKPRKDYEELKSVRFRRFIQGEREISTEVSMEEFQRQMDKEHEEDERLTYNYLNRPNVEMDPQADAKRFAEITGMKRFHKVYVFMAFVLCICIIGLLIYNVAYMPNYGSADAPTNNEVSEKYLEDGQADTGVVNMVTGMILQYRAFDTFGETHVLFIATCAVMILLFLKGKDEENAPHDPELDPEPDMILQTVARFLVPLVMIFGIYILLNGHLSPGGGFSGGAVMGAGLILYNAAFGFTKTGRFFNEKVYDILKVGSLALYAMIITYYLFTGANDIASIVPLGKVGAILSSGLILPINILVGVEVACTMYAFYALFRKGGF